MDTPIVSAPPRVYDATALLGFDTQSASPEAKLPEATKAGEIVLRYDGWNLQDLRDNAVVREKDIMCGQSWYNPYGWSAEKLPSGLYALRLSVPDSNYKTFAEQKDLLLPGEEPAPVVLAASGLLCHLLAASERLMKGHWLCCREQAGASNRVGLDWYGGRMDVSVGLDGYPDGSVWLASARRLPSEPCPSSP